MKKNLYILTFVIILTGCQSPKQSSNIVTTDIANFWEAYDQITATKDSILQYKYLDGLYFKKGTDGLNAIRRARNYTAQEYIASINKYPEFWNSVKANTLNANQYSTELEKGILKLKEMYPNLRPAKIYFTIGALRSNGTTLDNSVLIGSELALANKETPSHEFPENLSHLRSFFDSEPSKHIVFLNIHEYLHTQQKETIGNTLLSQTVMEGVGEFLAEIALAQKSPNPQIAFGFQHEESIKQAFEKEMFSPYVYNWIMNTTNNQFGMRDLGYFVGYAICKQYYAQFSDKKLAIKKMIELDYNNENDLIKFVEKSGYFAKPLHVFKESFEKSRPKVTRIEHIPSNTDVLTIHFSHKMDTRFRNFLLGPLGKKSVIRLKEFQGFSEDGKSVRFGIEKLKPAKKHQLVVGAGFKNTKGIPLSPYLIELEVIEK